jgi:hypothetical protein
MTMNLDATQGLARGQVWTRGETTLEIIGDRPMGPGREWMVRIRRPNNVISITALAADYVADNYTLHQT